MELPEYTGEKGHQTRTTRTYIPYIYRKSRIESALASLAQLYIENLKCHDKRVRSLRSLNYVEAVGKY